MNFKKRIWFMFYNYVIKHLPSNYSKINIGQRFLRECCLKNICEYVGGHNNIDDNVSFNYKLKIGYHSGIGSRGECCGDISIGKNVLIAPDVIMYTINHKFMDANKTIIEQGSMEEKPIIIGDDVWIGRRVMIMPGVTIGTGAVIGAGAVVAKNIPPYSIAVGNPIQIKKKRIN